MKFKILIIILLTLLLFAINVEALTCHSCGADIPTDAERCPYCGSYNKGTIIIKTIPTGAIVYFNGVNKGKSPVTIKGVKVGVKYNVIAKANGYKNGFKSVILPTEQQTKPTRTIKVICVSSDIHLTIDSEPSGADVYIDGELSGVTPFKKVIKKKKWKIEVKKDGYSSYNTIVTIEGESKNIKAKLIKLPEGMVYIPAGTFNMGSDVGNDDEKPIHKITLNPFYMDEHEITNADFKKFTDANPEWAPGGIKTKAYCDNNYLKYWAGKNYMEGEENLPVVYVSWYAAMAYTEWLGKRLPTEAEFEYALRGGLEDMTYPWGNESIPSSLIGNIMDDVLYEALKDDEEMLAEYKDYVFHGYNDEVSMFAFVKSYQPNAYGLYDIFGNAWEWCNDWYDTYYYESSPKKNPKGADDGNYRVIRGGGWEATIISARCSHRSNLGSTTSDISTSFRCVKDISDIAIISTDIKTDYSNMSYIEGTTFNMGISDEKLDDFIFNNSYWKKDWFIDSTPEHTIELTGFYLDKYEITNAEYQLFILANPDWAPDGQLAEQYTDGNYLYDWNGTDYIKGEGNYPVNYISWYAANAYAEWIGKRLPTEAEFEYALRGGKDSKLYPWGDKDKPLRKIGNLCDKSAKDMNADWQFIKGYDDGYAALAPIGVFDDNKFGLYDISGNLAEWCNDWYDSNYYNNSPKTDPKGADDGEYKMVRGGGWSHIPYSFLNARRYAQDPYTCLVDIGFRCASDGVGGY